MFAIARGLNSLKGEEFTETWKMFKQTENNKQTRKRYLRFISPIQNYQMYREAFSKTSLPAIPVIDILVEDLHTICSSKLTTPTEPQRTEIIATAVSKYLLKWFREPQQITYGYTKIPQLSDLFKNLNS